jgi:hypothetical protein
MVRKKRKKARRDITREIVTTMLAQPRMAKSARIAEMNPGAARITVQPSVTAPGTVDKIIPSRRPSQPEKAQIAMKGADRRKQDLRIENTLTGEHGEAVKLKKGAHVYVTVTAKKANRGD